MELKEAFDKNEYSEDDKKKQIEYYRNIILDRVEHIQEMYQKQYDAIPKRLKYKKEKAVLSTIYFVLCAFGVVFSLTLWGIMGFYIMLIIAALGYKLSFDAAQGVISYLVHSENSKMTAYIEKYNIYTLLMEQRDISSKISEIIDFKAKVRHMTFEELDILVNQGLNIDFVGRYADEEVMDGYYAGIWLWRFIRVLGMVGLCYLAYIVGYIFALYSF